MVNDRSEPRVKRARQILGIIARHLSRRCETNWPILIWLSSLLRRHDRRPLRYAAIPEVTTLRDDQFVFPPDWFLTKPRLQKVKVPSNRHYLKGQVLARLALSLALIFLSLLNIAFELTGFKVRLDPLDRTIVL